MIRFRSAYSGFYTFAIIFINGFRTPSLCFGITTKFLDIIESCTPVRVKNTKLILCRKFVFLRQKFSQSLWASFKPAVVSSGFKEKHLWKLVSRVCRSTDRHPADITTSIHLLFWRSSRIALRKDYPKFKLEYNKTRWYGLIFLFQIISAPQTVFTHK